MTLERVCWLTALLSSSSCRRICRSKSFQKSSKKVMTPKISISQAVRLRMTWFACRAPSLFLRFLASAMRISFPEKLCFLPFCLSGNSRRMAKTGVRSRLLTPSSFYGRVQLKYSTAA